MALRHRLLHPDLEYQPPPYDINFCADFGGCPPPPESYPDSVQIHIRHPDHHVTNLLIAAFSLLGSALIISAVIFFIIRRRRFRPAPPPPLQPPVDDPLLEPPVDHHIWNIRTVGLDASTIAAISIVRFKPSEGLIDGSDCAVCLGEFREGDELRLLPKCSHAFHIPCIDTWLGSRVSCPLCRAPIVAPRKIPPVSESIGLDLGFGDGSETPVPDGDRIDGNEQEEGERMIEVVISSCSQGSRSGTRAPDDLQPVRRSVSMDDSSLGALLLRVQLEEKKGGNVEEESHHGNRGKQVGDVKGEIVRKRVLRRVRSLSTSGRWFNLSRIGRVGRSPVLPV